MTHKMSGISQLFRKPVFLKPPWQNPGEKLKWGGGPPPPPPPYPQFISSVLDDLQK